MILRVPRCTCSDLVPIGSPLHDDSHFGKQSGCLQSCAVAADLSIALGCAQAENGLNPRVQSAGLVHSLAWRCSGCLIWQSVAAGAGPKQRPDLLKTVKLCYRSHQRHSVYHAACRWCQSGRQQPAGPLRQPLPAALRVAPQPRHSTAPLSSCM